MKKLGTMALALCMSAALAVPAFAAEDNGLLISPNPISQEVTTTATEEAYAHTIIINGEKMDTSALPVSDGIPLRMLAEADHGSASWYGEERTGYAYLDGASISFNADTLELSLDGEVVEGVSVELIKGVTFVPVEVIDGLDNYTVIASEADGVKTYSITTANNDPMVKLAYAIAEASNCYASFKSDLESYEMNYSLAEGTFTSGLQLTGMIVSPDCMMVAKLSENADREAVMAAMEEQKANLESTFSWYLSQNLPKVQDARMIIEGDYVLFLIAENADAGEQIFRDYVANVKTVAVEVVGKDGETVTMNLDTTAENLGQALVESGLVMGQTTEYGLYITTVNGYTADESAQEWWCITKGGATVDTGADTTPIADGDQFELTLKTGW